MVTRTGASEEDYGPDQEEHPPHGELDAWHFKKFLLPHYL